MDYDALLDLTARLGQCLLESGAEIYRTEESASRLLRAYGVDTGGVFAIPNCLIISLTAPDGRTLTRMVRVPGHGTDIHRLEELNALTRALCANPLELGEAAARLDGIVARRVHFSLRAQMAAYFVSSAFFTLSFGGTWRDGLCGGLCGLLIGLCLTAADTLRATAFLKTLVGGFASALLAIGLAAWGVGQNVDYITIGALMTLVPGLIFTNFMRDIMAGDTVAGLFKFAESLLLGTALAVGTALAMGLSALLQGGV